MPITSTWTTPSTLDRAIGEILTETIWDNLVSNELYLWDSVHNAAREITPLKMRLATNTTGAAGTFYKDTSGGLVLWGVSGSTNDFTLLNNAGAGLMSVTTAGLTTFPASAGVIVSGSGGFVVSGAGGAAVSGGPLTIGTTPATTGTVRFANASTVYFRDSGNTANLKVLELNAGGAAVLGDILTGGVTVRVDSSSVGGSLYTGNVSQFSWTSTGCLVGNPTGGLKGSGTLNANAVYDDNVILTDYVFEPDYALLPIGEMRAYYETHKHLPTIPGRDTWESDGSFPLGKIVTHLWETVEVQARYIAELHDRLLALGAR